MEIVYSKQTSKDYEKLKQFPPLIEKVKALIEEAGLEFVAAFDAFTMDVPKSDSERIYYIAREKRQEGKLYV